MRGEMSAALAAHLDRVTARHRVGVEDESRATRDELVTSHLKLVITIAARYARDVDELEDNVGEGHIALLNAADTFDHTRGSFTTWAAWYVMGKIRGKRRDALGALLGARRGSDVPVVVGVDDVEAAVTPCRALDAVLARQLAAHIDRLPAAQRAAVRGRLGGAGQEELAAAQGVTYQAIQNSARLGAARLAESFA